MARAVVLLGPPGSGKSTVGTELGRLGLAWRDWEPRLLEAWGDRQQFLANKEAALAGLHAELRAFIESADSAAVLESTGLSDRDFLDELQREQPGTLFVRLDVSETEALRRAAGRLQGRHLADDLEANRAVWRAFATHVAPNRRVDLVIDTESVGPAEAALTILGRLREPV